MRMIRCIIRLEHIGRESKVLTTTSASSLLYGYRMIVFERVLLAKLRIPYPHAGHAWSPIQKIGPPDTD